MVRQYRSHLLSRSLSKLRLKSAVLTESRNTLCSCKVAITAETLPQLASRFLTASIAAARSLFLSSSGFSLCRFIAKTKTSETDYLFLNQYTEEISKIADSNVSTQVCTCDAIPGFEGLDLSIDLKITWYTHAGNASSGHAFSGHALSGNAILGYYMNFAALNVDILTARMSRKKTESKVFPSHYYDPLSVSLSHHCLSSGSALCNAIRRLNAMRRCS